MSGSACFGAATALDPAQVAREFTQHSWQKKDGLPDNTVQALLQTRDGFLWIATRRGLARFDGTKFAVLDHLNSPAMVNDDCLSLAEDLAGNLWIGTADGLLRWHDGQFKRLTRTDGLACPNDEVRDFVGLVHANRLGGVWAATAGLNWVRDDTIWNFGHTQGLINYAFHSLHDAADGTFWTGGTVLHRFDEKAGRFTADPNTQTLGLIIRGVQDDGAGGLWLLCDNDRGSSWLYHYRGGKLEIAWDKFPGFRRTFLAADRHGDLWTAVDGELDRFHNGQLTRYLLPDSPSPAYVMCFLEDRDGNFWFGTQASGLHCWKPTAISALATRDGLANDSTWTIGEARDGSVWIGTENGLSQFKDGRFRNFTRSDSLAGDKIRSVAEDAAGNVWVGTGSGLSVIRDGVASRFDFPHMIEKDKTRVVLPAKDGALWLGTVAGLFRFQAGQWTTFTPTNGLAQAGLYGDVLALREDKSGTLWIGTAGGGLQSFRDGKITTWTTTNGLSNNSVWALHEDAERVLWIGTESGLNRFESNRFSAFTTREGLPADLVNEILEDDLGNFWVSHDHGIYRVRKQDLNEVAAGREKKVQTVSYDEADGLPSNETNGQKSYPAGCKTRDGRLWFPTPKGVAIINPKLCDLDTVAPQAVIEKVRADGEVIFDNSAAVVTGQPESLKSSPSNEKSSLARTRLRLPPGSGRVLEFRYTAPVFTAPEKAAFRYRLRGADDRWIEAGTRREAYFTRLRPGAYVFEVKAANHRGVWGERVGSFPFAIQPYFYQTWWFYVLCGGGAAGLVAGVVAWRLRELRKIHRLEQQTAITEERTRIAKDLHDGLGADLTRLTLLADLAGDESGAGGGEHARKLSQTSRAAARELRELIWVANPANDSVEGLVSRIAQTAEDFLRDARIKCRLEIAPRLPTWPLSLEQRRNLLLVAREALNNIVKHAAASEVRIQASTSAGALRLAIEDNGHGFDSATARVEGLGLASMKRRMESSGGEFEITSHSGGGTKILITVQLGIAENDSSKR